MICGDCGAAFHMFESWESHQCDASCAGDCVHERCQKCTSGNPDLQCKTCKPEPVRPAPRLGEWVGPIR